MARCRNLGRRTVGVGEERLPIAVEIALVTVHRLGDEGVEFGHIPGPEPDQHARYKMPVAEALPVLIYGSIYPFGDRPSDKALDEVRAVYQNLAEFIDDGDEEVLAIAKMMLYGSTRHPRACRNERRRRTGVSPLADTVDR
jgi:hypothetical protein